jgi:ribosomal protein L16 Arg81 hydroxylase
VSVYSEVDPDHVDHARHPRFGGVRSLEVLVHPGEALFIPVGWWHHVEALETSISVSFTNFLFPNTFSWQLPTLDR